jgi:hypothetical protein
MSQRSRIVLAFIVAASLPVLAFALPVLFTGQWKVALAIFAAGAALAGALIVAAGLPLQLWLRRSGHLRVYWFALTAGLALAAVPVMSAAFRTLTKSPDISYWHNGVLYFDGASLTWQGFIALFLVTPGYWFLAGCACGVIGWLIAFGPRAAPRF